MKRAGLLLAVLIAAAAVFMLEQRGTKAEQHISNAKINRFWILSDTHFITKELYDEGSAFEKMKETAAGKELCYQEESLTALVSKALREKPTGIIITGDLTFNGELASAEKLAAIFQPLKKAGILFFSIPGNHDIYNGWARQFGGDKQLMTEQIGPADFKELFADGYEKAGSTDKASLSYMINLNDRYRLLFLDSCLYGNQSTTSEPVTNGRIAKETLEWINEQLEEAKGKQQQTLVFLHHNLYEHNALLNQGYVLDNAAELRSILADYAVPAVFSGHIHIQDIATPPAGIPEIVTSAYPVYELGYGVLELAADRLLYQRMALPLEKWAKEQGSSKQELLQYTAFQQDVFNTASKKMATDQLNMDETLTQEELQETTGFVASLNAALFTGNDAYTKEERRQLRASDSYALVQQQSFLGDYVESLLTDESADRKIIINLE